MHRIRSTARRQAWYRTQDEPPNWNPFQKLHKQNKIVDAEVGGRDPVDGRPPLLSPGTYASADYVDSPSDTQRRSHFEGDEIRHGVRNVHTFPINVDDSIGNLEALNTSIASTRKGTKENSEDSNATTDRTLVNGDGTSTQVNGDGSSTGVRKRGFLSRLGRKDQEASDIDTEKPRSTKKFTPWSQVRATIFNSWINILIIAAPVGIALNYVKSVSPVVVFVINFIAIIPLAAMLSYATEEIALRTGETIGGLLNATFGNAVELIVSILALVQNQVLVVQTSLIGSILSNLLLVMGMCFFFGGLDRPKQHFNITVALTASSLLALAAGGLIIPTAYAIFAPSVNPGTPVPQSNTAALSRGTAILMLIVYGSYLFFQLKTHISLYNEESKKVERKSKKRGEGDTGKGVAAIGGVFAKVAGQTASDNVQEKPKEEERQEPELALFVAIFTLAASTALVAVCAEYMVGSINALTTGPHGISKTFVGLILLPIVGNAAEHATAVTVACKDKMDLAIGVAVGSSLQIALFVLPFIVVLGWILGNDQMTLAFGGFEIVVLFVAIYLINSLIADGESHWLEGALLQILYLIIAISAWYYPSPAGQAVS